jgi:8-oxo-dGTP pyrophosphatase MutT (NUDIX family)
MLLPEAELPAKDVLPGLVRQPLRALTRQVKALGDGGSEDELHQVRIRAKRARYAAEAVAPVLGKRARAVARAAASLQETLGEHQDAIVAERWLRAWVQGSRSVPAAFTAGELAGLERAAAADARARWPAYDDWSFPKGKLHQGETEAEAALREVQEETGLRCRLGREVGTTAYRDPKRRPKTVRYWEMIPTGDTLAAANEVDDARWMPVGEARRALTYEHDRRILDRFTSSG